MASRAAELFFFFFFFFGVSAAFSGDSAAPDASSAGATRADPPPPLSWRERPTRIARFALARERIKGIFAKGAIMTARDQKTWAAKKPSRRPQCGARATIGAGSALSSPVRRSSTTRHAEESLHRRRGPRQDRADEDGGAGDDPEEGHLDRYERGAKHESEKSERLQDEGHRRLVVGERMRMWRRRRGPGGVHCSQRSGLWVMS
jgi:hypothetical protein